MKMDKPIVFKLPMTSAEYCRLIREHISDEILTSIIMDKIDLPLVIRIHNAQQLTQYYKSMLPDTQITVCDDFKLIKYYYSGEETTQEHLDRLIELRCFL